MSESTREPTPADRLARLDEILELRAGPRIDPLIAFGRDLVATGGGGGITRERTVRALLDLLEAFAGNGRQRLEMGEVLGLLGDPRLRTPADGDYWREVPMREGGTVLLGAFPVTTAEFRAWAESEDAGNRAHWSDAGWDWKTSGAAPWSVLADNPESATLVVPNQPVAGVTWWEAEAYATAHGARLLTAG